jgi:hypothetical protein
VYFTENFDNNAKGWTLDATWAIGAAVAGGGGSPDASNPDPAKDHTGDAANGVAGVVLGGNYPGPAAFPGTYLYLTSPSINLSAATGSVFLTFWRWLNSDYPPYVNNQVQVSSDGGVTWTTVWASPSFITIHDNAWQQVANPPPAGAYPTEFDITAFKTATFQFRIGYQVASAGFFADSGWNVDDVRIASSLCP